MADDDLPRRIAIVGVGMIGASIGLSMKRIGHTGTIIGIARKQSTIDQALAVGAINQGQTSIDENLRDVDFVIVCTPVDQIVPTVERLDRVLSPDGLITDVGSTKERIVTEVEQRWPTRRFVGSHPIAGSDKTGPRAGSATVFRERTCIITPTKGTDTATLTQACHFWRRLDMHVVEMTPTEHDRLLAKTSHLPHVLAALLASMIEPTDQPGVGTGLKDTTRIAGGDPALWSAICQHNAGRLHEVLVDFRRRLDQFDAALTAGDVSAITKLLQSGKDARDQIVNSQ